MHILKEGGGASIQRNINKRWVKKIEDTIKNNE